MSTLRPAPASEVARRFTEAWNRRDLDAVLGLTAEDCVFDSANRTGIGRVVGRERLRACWGDLLASAQGEFVIDAVHASQQHVTLVWTMRAPDRAVAGVDLFVVRDGLVHEKSGFVKV